MFHDRITPPAIHWTPRNDRQSTKILTHRVWSCSLILVACVDCTAIRAAMSNKGSFKGKGKATPDAFRKGAAKQGPSSNPFERIQQRVKHQVIGRAVKGTVNNAEAKKKSLEQRRQALLQSWEQSEKGNK